jgi:hypothetical protein
MTPAENDELIKYFKVRQLWLLEADETPPKVSKVTFSAPTNSARQQQTEVPK